MSADIASTPDELVFVMIVEDFGMNEGLKAATNFGYKCLRPLLAIVAQQQGLYDMREDARKRSLAQWLSKLESVSKTPGQSQARKSR